MKQYFRILSSIAVILYSIHLSALNGEQMKFHSLSVNDGLSQHDITGIVEDSFGFIWISTYDGLNRYDGKKIQIFRHSTRDENSLSGNRIMCIMEDSRMRLWIGTDGYGINYYSLIEERIVRISIPWNCKIVFSIAEGKDGKIYAATNNGLLLVDTERNTAGLLQLPVAGLLVSGITVLNDLLYLATEQGLWVFDGEQCELITGIPQENYAFVTTDRKEHIWVATRTAITKLKTSGAPEKVGYAVIEPDNIIRSLHYDDSGKLLVGTQANGIYMYNENSMLLSEIIQDEPDNPRGLKSNSITALLVDEQNILWVGTSSGFYFTDLEALPFHTFPLGNSNAQIGFIYAGEDYVYLSRGISESVCYSMNRGKFELIPSNLPIDMKKVININGKNVITTGVGIFIQKSPGSHDYVPYNLKTRNETDRSHIYTSLVIDDFGNRYIGTWRGLIIEKADGKADWIDYWSTKAEILRNEGIYDLFYDNRTRSIWVGTVSSGLFRVNLDNAGDILSIQNYCITGNSGFYIPCNQIWVIFLSSDGTLWLGTDAGLLYKSNDSESFTQIENEEILDKKIMSIQEDNQGNLWMGNTQGLIRYSPSEKRAKRFTYDDGLQSNTFTEASAKTADGTLLFGGLQGINWFNPEEIISNDKPARITLSGLLVNNEYIRPSDTNHRALLDSTITMKTSLTLSHYQNDLALEYITIPFSNIQKYKTRYMLRGIDSEWVDAANTNMVAWYKNLPAGKYSFIVESYGSDDSGKIVSRHIDIRIKPAPWATWWAYLIYFIILLTIAYIIRYVYERHRRLKRQMELDKIHMEQEEKMNEMKLMFFTDIAHEFKTPLSLIVGPVNDLVEKGPANEDQNFCFKVISRNVRRMMFLVNQLLDFRKITKGRYSLRVAEMDLAVFVNQVAKAFAWEANSEQVNFNVNTPEELICWFDPDIIEKVLYNILSNAFRYTRTGGIVEINVRSIWKNSHFIAEISVVDNGPGIDDDMKPHVFERFYHGTSRLSSGVGLHLSDQLIREHHGEIHLTDSVYNGVEFIISFPGSADAYSANEFQQYQEEKSRSWLSDDSLPDDKPVETDDTNQRDRLLIVEDDIDLRHYLRKCLESRYMISEARNGAEGLKKVAQVVPDLIISDVMMPEMDGLEMVRRIKSDESLSHIPIILLTAKTDIEYQNEGFEAGVFDYICKPFNTKILLRKIDNLIEQQTAYKRHILAGNIAMEINANYTSYDRKLMDKLNALIEENLDNSEMTIEFLAKELGISRMQLHRKIKAITGESSTSYVNLIKMRYARNMFDSGCDRVLEVMDAVGISSSSYFNKLFKTHFNDTPSGYLMKREKMQ